MGYKLISPKGTWTFFSLPLDGETFGSFLIGIFLPEICWPLLCRTCLRVGVLSPTGLGYSMVTFDAAFRLWVAAITCTTILLQIRQKWLFGSVIPHNNSPPIASWGQDKGVFSVAVQHLRHPVILYSERKYPHDARHSFFFVKPYQTDIGCIVYHRDKAIFSIPFLKNTYDGSVKLGWVPWSIPTVPTRSGIQLVAFSLPASTCYEVPSDGTCADWYSVRFIQFLHRKSQVKNIVLLALHRYYLFHHCLRYSAVRYLAQFLWTKSVSLYLRCEAFFLAH